MSVSEATRQKEEVSDLVLYAEEIEYFDTHDLSEELANGPDIRLNSTNTKNREYIEIEMALVVEVEAIAKKRGISAAALLEEWLREKLAETEAVGAAK